MLGKFVRRLSHGKDTSDSHPRLKTSKEQHDHDQLHKQEGVADNSSVNYFDQYPCDMI